MTQETWRDIESAPKDGTWILLHEKWTKVPFVGRWDCGEWSSSHEHLSTSGDAVVIDIINQAWVHQWMPLPPCT